MENNTTSNQNGKPDGVPDLQNSTSNKKREKPHRDKPATPDINSIRWFLVKGTMALMFFDLMIYALVRDANVLLSSTLVGIAVTAIFAFYFNKR